MKSPEYVGFITKFYRSLIDNYDNVDLSLENTKLKTIYNRKFTNGHLFNSTVSDIMNIDSPNHIGLPIGKVLEVTKNKIKISLNDELHQGDGIRFLKSGKGLIVNYLYDKNHKLVSSCADICYIDNNINLDICDSVNKTLDYKLNLELKKLPVKKIPVTFKVVAEVGKQLSITISDGTNTITELGVVVDKSINNPLSSDRIKEQLEKLGNTPFSSEGIILQKDENIFINIKDINNLRRTVVDLLVERRSNAKKEIVVNDANLSLAVTKKKPSSSKFSALVYNEEQLNKCLQLGFKRIYIASKELYNKYQCYENIFFRLPRCLYSVPTNFSRCLINDYIASDLYIGDYFLNIYNIYTAYYLYKMGFKTITLSVELDDNEIKEFVNKFVNKFGFLPDIEILAYGRCENMLIKGNILNININDYSYQLVDVNSRHFPVYFDGANTTILNYRNFNRNSSFTENVDIRFNFFNESSSEIESIVNKF